MSSQRFAVFDIGSNSTKVLIASVNRDGSFRKITEEGLYLQVVRVWKS